MELLMLLGAILVLFVAVTYVGTWLIVFGMLLAVFKVLPWWTLLLGFIAWFTTEYRAVVNEEAKLQDHS